ncbi:MAG: hypothetical protein ACR2M3_18210, partial [Thermomicrobiales bacterium]
MSDETIQETRDFLPQDELAADLGIDSYQEKFGFHDSEANYAVKFDRGLNHDVVERISALKKEPEWMRAIRHKSLDYFEARPLPMWGGDLTEI